MKRSSFIVIAAVLGLAACIDEDPDPNVGSFERATGMQIDNPDEMGQGTFRGATGADPGMANMVQCSDGRFYEDCRYSPRSY